MITIGIDPGAHSAIAILKYGEGSDNPKILGVESIDLSKIKGTGNKLFTYHNRLLTLLSQYKPTVVYCEEPYIKFMQAAKSMNKLLGIIEYTVFDFDPAIKIAFINPSVVKKAVTGSGRADKDVLADSLMGKVTNNRIISTLIADKKWDETDSIAIALAGYITGGI